MFFSTLTGQLPGAKIMILLFSNLHVHGKFMELASTGIISIDTVVQYSAWNFPGSLWNLQVLLV